MHVGMVPLGVVSVAYMAAFFISLGILMPLQSATLPAFANHASILFLPHGVRVLTAWLFGWRALPLLAPSALLTHAYLYGTAGFSTGYFFAALFGVFCATASFWLLAKLGLEFRHSLSKLSSWREILLAGSFASVINVAGTWLFYGLDFPSASAYFVGDVGGMVAAMLILMLVFRIWRKCRPLA